MRPLVIGILPLVLISGLAPAAVAEVINPFLSFPSVPWEFSTQTNTFSGEGGGGLNFQDGILTLRAKFDDEGNFKTGTFQYRAPDHHLLLHGLVTGAGVVPVEGSGIEGVPSHYWVTFGLDFQGQDNLPFPVDGGEFWAFVCDSRGGFCVTDSGGPTSLEGVFTTDYPDASVPLNNYLITYHDDVSAALFLVAQVPTPAPGVLLGVGMVILVTMRMRRLT